MKSTLQPWIAVSALALVAAVGGWLRFQIATQDLLWLDELHTGWVVDAPSWSDVATRAADGNQTPVFFWLTRCFVQLPIQSELGLRLTSVIAGIALILIAAIGVWKWSGSRLGGLLTGVLIALDLSFIYYSTEARPYALIEFLSVVQFGILFQIIWPSPASEDVRKIRTSGSRFRLQLAFALLSLLLIYTHLTSVWLLVTDAIMLAVCFFHSPALIRRVSLWLPAIVVICLGFLPFSIITRNIYSRRDNWEAVSSVSNLLANILPDLLVTVCLPLVLLAVYFSLKKTKPRPTTQQLQQLGLILLWAFIPFLCVIIAGLLNIAPLALHRYTLVGAAAIPIFAGCCVGCLQSTLEKTTFVGLIFMGVIVTGNTINPFVGSDTLPHFRVENWQTPIEKINSAKAESNYPVFVFANIIEDSDAMKIADLRFQKYLLFPVSWPYSLDRLYPEVSSGPTLEEPHFSATQIQQAFTNKGCWVIVRGTKELAERIGFELEFRLEIEMARDFPISKSPIKSQFYETPGSRVYLISVEW